MKSQYFQSMQWHCEKQVSFIPVHQA